MKIIKKIAAMAVAAAMAAGIGTTAYAENEVKLVVLGDSIATGYGLKNYSTENCYAASDSFANITAAALEAKPNESFYNLAVNGATSDDLVKVLDNENAAEKVSSAEKIVISIGGNDLLQPMLTLMAEGFAAQKDYVESLGVTIDESSHAALLNSLAAAVQADKDGVVIKGISDYVSSDSSKALLEKCAGAYEENLVAILDKVYALNPKSEVYILTLYNPFSGVPGFEAMDEMGKEMTAIINDGIYSAQKSIADKGYTLNVADSASAINISPLMTTNISSMDIHPNAQGHRLIAAVLLQKMGIEVNSTVSEEETSEETVQNTESEQNSEEAAAAAYEAVQSDSATTAAKTGNTSASVVICILSTAFAAAGLTFRRKK